MYFYTFFFFVTPLDLWILSFLTRDGTHTFCIGIVCVLYTFLFVFLATPLDMWILSFLTRAGPPALEEQSLNHWTTREVLYMVLYRIF